MDGVQLVGDTEGDAQSNSEQFYQEEHQQWGQAQEALTESVLLDQSEQEAHWDVLQDQGSEDQIDAVQKIREVYFERKGVEAQLNTKEVENFDQRVETQVDQREESEKQVDQSKVENQVNQKEEVEEQVEQEEEVENQTDQKEEVERKVNQEDEFKKVERVIKKENQVNQEFNEYLHQKEHLNPSQESVEEVDKQKEFQGEVSLEEKEATLKEESKEKVNQEQEVEEQVTHKREVEEQVNDKVKEYLIKQEEQINHNRKDTEKLDQKITDVDWKERYNKVPTYRRQSISESRQKWEVHDKEQEPKLDNNVNNRERGEKIKFIEKELQTAGVIMAEAKTSRFGGTNEKCAQCNRTVYAMEKMEVIGRVMHKTCFRCCKCNSPLSVGRFSVGGADLYCLTHYKQAFREKGTYDVFTPNNPCKGKWQQNIDTPGAPKAQE